jgi:hypothetical protein
MFHPTGLVVRGEVTALPGRTLAAVPDLSGPALVRLSGALWRRSQRLPDVLGCAVRIGSPERPPGLSPVADDQDLLFATIPSSPLLLLAPFMTDVRDHLANVYQALGEFAAVGGERVVLRLRPLARSPDGPSRLERLRQAIADGAAVLVIEASPARHPRSTWTPVAAVRLVRPLETDPWRLGFDPFQAGRGLVPRGFVHALRPATYAASQRTRGAGRRGRVPRGRAAVEAREREAGERRGRPTTRSRS